jgi:hypothetical protein
MVLALCMRRRPVQLRECGKNAWTTRTYVNCDNKHARTRGSSLSTTLDFNLHSERLNMVAWDVHS